MDSITSEVLSRLKFIGKIQPSEKINVKYLYVQTDSWATRVLRTLFSPDNRNNALSFFKATLDKSFEIVNANKDNKEKIPMVRNILRDIENATLGINHFKETYKTDVMYCCEIDTLVQSVLLRLDDLRSYIDGRSYIDEKDIDNEQE
jgi:hypothetical protein